MTMPPDVTGSFGPSPQFFPVPILKSDFHSFCSLDNIYPKVR